MKKIFALTLITISILSFAQTPRFAKYSVATTPVEIYLPTEPKWHPTKAKDGSEIYIYDDHFGKINYTAIIVKLSTATTVENSENLLQQYLLSSEDSFFSLVQKAGIGKGHTLDNQPLVKGILQMGKSKDGKEYKIMGWTDGTYIAVLATSSLAEMNYNIQEMFLRGIRFPQ